MYEDNITDEECTTCADIQHSPLVWVYYSKCNSK